MKRYFLNYKMVLLILALCLGGCATVSISSSKHTATELMLMSKATRDAINKLDVSGLRDRKVYVSAKYFKAQRRDYCLAQLRAHLLSQGVRVVNSIDKAQVILEFRSGGIGIDRYDYLLGIPPIFMPASGNQAGGNSAVVGSYITPELAIFKSLKQKGYAEFAYVAYWKKTGEILSSSGPFVGRTYREDWWFLGLGPYTDGNTPTADGKTTH